MGPCSPACRVPYQVRPGTTTSGGGSGAAYKTCAHAARGPGSAWRLEPAEHPKGSQNIYQHLKSIKIFLNDDVMKLQGHKILKTLISISFTVLRSESVIFWYLFVFLNYEIII